MPENIVDSAGLWDDRELARLVTDEIVARGGASIQTPDGMVAFGADGIPHAVDGSVRSRFARFDPRLAHLKNLNALFFPALIAGGLYATQQPSQPEELRNYLSGL